jgi:hypothetical protein
MFDIGDSLRVWAWVLGILIALFGVGCWALGRFL